MAPEMARGIPDVDGRADIYALGCVAYWLLTGQRVFDEESPLAMIAQHLKTTPEPPSRRGEIEIPPDLEQLVLSCLEKERALRPRDAWELDARLAACEAAEEWGGQRARSWWELNLPDVPDSQPVADDEAATPEAILKPRL